MPARDQFEEQANGGNDTNDVESLHVSASFPELVQALAERHGITQQEVFERFRGIMRLPGSPR